MSAHEDFDFERDHPSALVWAEDGLTYDWAEGNTRERRLNVSRASVAVNASSVRGWVGLMLGGSMPSTALHSITITHNIKIGLFLLVLRARALYTDGLPLRPRKPAHPDLQARP